MIVIAPRKSCTKCGCDLPVDQFHNDASKPDGKSSQCVHCRRENHRNWLLKNKDRAAARAKKWREAHPDKFKEHQRRHCERHPEKRRKDVLRVYGLTLSDYDALLAEQQGVCAICREPSSERLVVDHDHETGKIRGLLCRQCNAAIGLLKDDRLRVMAAYIYLQHAYLKERGDIC